jgi:hypothetical protein
VLAERWRRRNSAAVLIQSCWRGCLVRRQNGWMKRFLQKCLVAYEALRQTRQAFVSMLLHPCCLAANGSSADLMMR